MARNRNISLGIGWKRRCALASLLALLILSWLGAAAEFEMFPDKDSYYLNQEVYLIISGPGDSDFLVQVLNPLGSVVSEKSGRTTASGNAYLSYSGFSSSGTYEVRLIADGNVKAVSSFSVAAAGATTTTPTTSTTMPYTTITVTTSFISPTTPTTTVVTTGGGGADTAPPDPVPSTLFDFTNVTLPPSSDEPAPSDEPAAGLFNVMSEKDGFELSENPKFRVETDELMLLSVEVRTAPEVILKDSEDKVINVKPQIDANGNDYTIELPKKKSIQPGRYKLIVELSGERKEVWFSWGLVSVNTKKSMYHPNETAEILMVVLNKGGYPVSGAEVQLEVRSPVGVSEQYSTLDGNIVETGKGVYAAEYAGTWSEGNYTMSVTATAEGVMSSIKSYFMVKEFYEFDVLRDIPVVIDPLAGSTRSKIRIVSYVNSSSFTLRERLPRELDVNDSGGAVVSSTSDETVLEWTNLANNSVVSYSVQVPLVWPFLYEIGPAEIAYDSKTFIEARPWLLAVDPTVYSRLILFWNGTADAPTGWTCLSCNSSGQFYNKFPRGNNTYGGTGGGASHTHTISLVSMGLGATLGVRNTGTIASTSTHTHSITSLSVVNSSNLPAYKNIKVIAYNNGVPAVIPAGAIAIFNTSSLPSDWSRYSAEDNYFLRGSINLSTGGSNTHTHSVSYSLPATGSTVSVGANNAAVATGAHTHTASGTSSNIDKRPPYLNVVFAIATVNTSIPGGSSGMIAMFNATPPANWQVLSGSGGAFASKFIVGSASYGSPGGVQSHTHSNLNSTSSVPVGTFLARTGTATYVGSSAHTHWSVVSFASSSNIPPYINVIFAMMKVKVNTDRLGYFATETVNITGYGWGAGSTVTVNIKNPSGGSVSGYPKNRTANATGWISDSWTIPAGSSLGTYTLTALRPSSPSVNDTVTFSVSTMSVNITYPKSDPGISESGSFDMNCTVNCSGGTCTSVNVYAIYCSGSLSCSPNKKLNTTSSGLRADYDSISLGSLTNEKKTAKFTVTGQTTGDYVIACNATSSSVKVTSLPTKTSLHVNDPPIAVWAYPSSAGTLVSGTVVLNASGSSDSDGTIQYAEFWGDSSSGYGSTNLICNDTSSSSGWTCSWNTKTDTECTTDGACYLKVVVVDDDKAKNSSNTNVVIHNKPPAWSRQNQTIARKYVTVAHRGDSVLLSAYWTDVNLSQARLSTNETGSWANKTTYGSPMSLSGASAWTNFSWSNSSVGLGTLVGWRIYANDTSGFLNKTNIMSFRVWGWSKVSDSNLNPSSINTGEYTTMSCKVVDNLSSASIQNYPVRFYNSTGLLGTNNTGSDGWAYYTFRDNSAGLETIRCNITDNSTLYYNDTTENFAQQDLSTEASGSPTIYRITTDPCERGTYCRDGIIVYNPNPNTTRITSLKDIWSTDRITSIRQCCTPDGCNVAYCTETPAGTIRFNNQSAWVLQPRSYLIFWYEILNNNVASANTLTANLTTAEYGSKTQARAAVDIVNTGACAWTAWNDTEGFDVEASTPNMLEADISTKKNFTLRLREYCNQAALQAGSNQVKVVIPSGWTIGTTDSRCGKSSNVITCNLSVNLINAYTDYRIELTSPNVVRRDVFLTNVSGNDAGARAHQDTNQHVVITHDRSAPKWSFQNQTRGGKYVSVVHWGDSILLSARWTDNLQLAYAKLSTNETGIWANKTTYGSPMSLSGASAWTNFSWSNSSLGLGTLVGWRVYSNDTSSNLNRTNVMSFRLWGWSNASWVSPFGGNYSGSKNIKLVCRVRDANTSSGINNYPVNFYRNSTLIGSNKTNSSGYAVYNWNTGSVSGNYVLKCNISDNSTLYYNKTAQNSGSTTVAVDAIYPRVTPLSPSSGTYTADTSLNLTFKPTDDLAALLNCSLYVDSKLNQTNSSTKNNTQTKFTVNGLSVAFHQWNISCRDYVLNKNWSTKWNFTVYPSRQVNMTLINSTGTTFVDTTLVISDKLGQVVSSKNITAADSKLSDLLALNQLYDLKMATQVSGGSLTAVIRDLTVSGNLQLRPQVVKNYTGNMPKLDGITSLYALNDSGLSYSHAELSIPKNSLLVNSIVHCTNWSFAEANCYDWEVNASEDYGMQENSSHIWFNVTDFTAFGGGKSKPLPNVTAIRVYDVTGRSGTHTGGTLIGSGLNTTFNFFKRTLKTYRVEFDVRNDATTQWTIASGDVVYHSGLNSTWQVSPSRDVWYSIAGVNYTSGTWSGGKVSWNMSKGGKLTNKQVGTFYYVFNMTTSKTEKYQVYFLCNDTSTNSGSYDRSTYNITRVGYLEANLTVPPKIPGQGDAESNGGYKVGQGKLFSINATVYCRDGFCGNVNGTLRYNSSSALPNTRVSTTAGAKPFYVTSGTNPRVCSGNPLIQDEFCQLTWTVNSTGNLTSLWKMDALFNSSKAASNNTNYVVIDISLILIMSLSWAQTGFGVCDPVTFGNPAVGNSFKGYNVTLDPNSNDANGLYIKGTDLVPRTIAGYGSVSYLIGVGNLSWNGVANNVTGLNTTRLSSAYRQVKSTMPAGSKVSMYYWIDIPRGQFNQPYDGTMYLMVNKTQAY